MPGIANIFNLEGNVKMCSIQKPRCVILHMPLHKKKYTQRNVAYHTEHLAQIQYKVIDWRDRMALTVFSRTSQENHNETLKKVEKILLKSDYQLASKIQDKKKSI